jgi:hypothetical protein
MISTILRYAPQRKVCLLEAQKADYHEHLTLGQELSSEAGSSGVRVGYRSGTGRPVTYAQACALLGKSRHHPASVRRHMVPDGGHIRSLARRLIDHLAVTHDQDAV